MTVGGYDIFFLRVDINFGIETSWWNSKTALFLRLFQSLTDLAVMEWVT